MWSIIKNAVEVWGKEYTGPKFHAVLSDPPYGLKFMGKDWDTISAEEWGRAILPHLYTGAVCLMFGGTRTWHKLAAGMEAAGFQMFDTLMWVYGSGFPKAQDLSVLIDKLNGDPRKVIGINPHAVKQTGTDGTAALNARGAIPFVTAPGSEESAKWQGHKTPALKPGWEPVLAFAAPRDGMTYAELARMYGAGSLNIDACRIGVDHGDCDCPCDVCAIGTGQHCGLPPCDVTAGRFPANLIFDEEAAALLDRMTGVIESADGWHTRGNSQECYGEYGEAWHAGFGDTGGASRFFYCSKASPQERNAGLVALRNNHPCVKPVDLTTWLAKLLLPPEHVTPRRLLVPFSGSGSEVMGALRAGWDEVTGIERDSQYAALSELRVAGDAPLFNLGTQ
jgi:hypothetical protein